MAEVRASNLIVRNNEPHTLALCGGKAFALWRLKEEGFPIPDWFVVSPNAFAEGVLTPETKREIEATLTRMRLRDAPLAVRSSSVEEDATGSSFAGQFESYLGVSASELERFVVKVWKSGYAERVAAYKDARGEDGGFKPPAILVQRLVDADAAGVAFSVDPVSGKWDHCIGSAVLGLGSTLVEGESDADSFTIDRTGEVVRSDVVRKNARRVR